MIREAMRTATRYYTRDLLTRALQKNVISPLFYTFLASLNVYYIIKEQRFHIIIAKGFNHLVRSVHSLVSVSVTEYFSNRCHLYLQTLSFATADSVSVSLLMRDTG